MICLPGDVAQLGERDNRTVEVRGSSPLISTICYTAKKTNSSIEELTNRKRTWYSILYKQS